MNINELKIIARNKDINPAKIRSKFSLMKIKKNFQNSNDFIIFFGISNIMQNLFEENFEGDSLENSILYKQYLNIKSNYINNENFKILYRINEDIGLEICKHIYLYRIVSDVKINREPLLPWYYVGNKRYIADTWWEKDEEIIIDINNLTLVNFITKYKGI